MKRRLLLGVATMLAVLASCARTVAAQGVTTGAVSGTVTDETGQLLADAQVRVTNTTTGRGVGAVTRGNGQYLVQGLEPDNSYRITVRRIGFQPVTHQGVRVTLGQTAREDFVLHTQAQVLTSVTVSATIDPVINASKTGTGTTVSDSALSRLPTLNRNFADFVQLVPQVQTNTVGLSGGGVNVRQNAIQIDGAQAGDLFGLGTTGQPGAQANAKSIPLDAVKEYQVLLSPFDVRQGNFGGLLINAVTKTGTNVFHGSAYGYTRDQALTRRQPYLNEYTQQQYGVSLGGPIVKDRVFFFGNFEGQRQKQPASGPYIGSTDPKATVSQATIDQFNTIAQSTYGLPNLGGGAKINRENPLTNVFARVDAYLPWNTHLVVRHNYAKADQTTFSRSNPTSTTPNFNLTSNLYQFSNETNSTVLELLTNLPSGVFNEFLLNRSTIRDFRTVPVWTPMLTVQNLQRADTNLANARLVAGTENSSQGNSLDQDINEITNNLTIPVGAHALTVGVKGIFFKPVNLFAQNRLGNWTFTSMMNFQNGAPSSYQVSAPAPSDPAGGLATFHANNYSLYAQDQWTVTPRLTLNLGVRYEKPDFRDAPPENDAVFAEYGRHTSSVPTRATLAPRFGFNWDVTGDGKNQLRGGIGNFTGSVPFVYLSNAFGNSGRSGFASLTCGGGVTSSASLLPPQFNPANITTPPTQCRDSVIAGLIFRRGASVTTSSNIATIDPNFRFPTYQKATLGYDRRLGWGLIGTLEGLVTRSVDNVFYRNLALNTDSVRAGAGQGGRWMYGRLTTTQSQPFYRGNRTQVIDVTNSSGDYIASVTAQLQKSFADRWEGSVAYTYQHAQDVTTTTSSTQGSNYRYQRSVKGDILAKTRSTSKNDQPHRIVSTVSYSFPTRTDISVIYQGNSGAPFDWVYGASGAFGDLNADGQTQNDLVYVPKDVNNTSEIQFRQSGAVTPAQQAAAFDRFIESMDCLRSARGRIMDRNSCRNPWINEFDVSVAQSLRTLGVGNAQLRLDIMNFGNLLNRKWGAQAYSDQNSTCGNLCGSTLLLTHVGNALPTGTTSGFTAVPIVQFNPDFHAFNAQNASSNYRMQLSVRYSF